MSKYEAILFSTMLATMGFGDTGPDPEPKSLQGIRERKAKEAEARKQKHLAQKQARDKQ